MAQTIDFVSLLHKSQEYISENYAAALSDRSKIVQSDHISRSICTTAALRLRV